MIGLQRQRLVHTGPCPLEVLHAVLQLGDGHVHGRVVGLRTERPLGQPAAPPAPGAAATLEQGEPGQGRTVTGIELHGPAHEVPALTPGRRQLGGGERRPRVVGVEGQRLTSLAARLVDASDVEQAERELEVCLRQVGEVGAQAAGLLHDALVLPHLVQQGDPLQAARAAGAVVVGMLRHAAARGPS